MNANRRNNRQSLLNETVTVPPGRAVGRAMFTPLRRNTPFSPARATVRARCAANAQPTRNLGDLFAAAKKHLEFRPAEAVEDIGFLQARTAGLINAAANEIELIDVMRVSVDRDLDARVVHESRIRH